MRIGSAPSFPTTPSAVSTQVRTRFLGAVYQWMAGGLALTAAVALLVVGSPTLLTALVYQRGVFFTLLLAELGLVVWLSGWIHRMSVRTASWAFLGYAVLNGVTLSTLFAAYAGSSVVIAFAATAAVFGSAAVYGTVTGRDLSSAGSFAFMGLVGVLVGSALNWFFHSPALDWAITYAGILVFVILAAYDAQKVQRIGFSAAAQGEGALSRAAILGALALYLDFINLFLLILRVVGRSRD